MAHGQGERAHARMAQRHGQHMAQLQAKLQLAAAQGGAWASFSAAMQPPAPPAAPVDVPALRNMTTPERIDHLLAKRSQRQAQMDKRMEAAKVFYASLSAEQKTVFDQETLAHWRHHGAHAGGRRMGH